MRRRASVVAVQKAALVGKERILVGVDVFEDKLSDLLALFGAVGADLIGRRRGLGRGGRDRKDQHHRADVDHVTFLGSLA